MTRIPAAAIATALVGALAIGSGAALADKGKSSGDKKKAPSVKKAPATPVPPAYGPPQYGRLGGENFYEARLLGRNEIGPTGRKNAGNPIGRGVAQVGLNGTILCASVITFNTGVAAAAHIHIGKQGRNGAVVVPLPTPTPLSPGSVFASSSSGCQQVGATLAKAIRKHPNRYYVNVHTGDFPAGAIRGQLEPVRHSGKK